jgi:hypothetical protein
MDTTVVDRFPTYSLIRPKRPVKKDTIMDTVRKSQERSGSGDNADDLTSVTSERFVRPPGFREAIFPSIVHCVRRTKKMTLANLYCRSGHGGLGTRCFQRDNKCLAFRCSELQQTIESRRRIVNETEPIRPSVCLISLSPDPALILRASVPT